MRLEIRRVPQILAGLLVAASSVVTVAHSSVAFATARAGSVVSVQHTSQYGSILVVGSGVLSGYPLYEFSGDHGAKFGCGITMAQGYDLGPIASVPLTCSGPMRDMLQGNAIDDWPAFTTRGAPIARHGANQRLLGTTYRQGIGDQVTYGGHPLYLFDPPSRPFKPAGEDYVETVHPLAPWHGYWELVSSLTGAPAPGVATLEPGVLPNGTRVLAVERDINVRPLALTVYTLRGNAGGVAQCDTACQTDWVPLLTSGVPRAIGAVHDSALGVIKRADDTEQVTYDGNPLYLFAKERVFLTTHIKLRVTGTAGNGEGILEGSKTRSAYVELVNQ